MGQARDNDKQNKKYITIREKKEDRRWQGSGSEERHKRSYHCCPTDMKREGLVNREREGH